MRILGKRVLIKPIKIEDITKSGIILQTSKKRHFEGEIISLGDVEGLEVGQRVVYSEYGGKEAKIDDEKYEIVNYDDILAVYEN